MTFRRKIAIFYQYKLQEDDFHFVVCSINKYGPDCNHTCGQCLDNLPCHHINGTRQGGCAPGFKGKNCKTGKECTLLYTN